MGRNKRITGRKKGENKSKIDLSLYMAGKAR